MEIHIPLISVVYRTIYPYATRAPFYLYYNQRNLQLNMCLEKNFNYNISVNRILTLTNDINYQNIICKISEHILCIVQYYISDKIIQISNSLVDIEQLSSILNKSSLQGIMTPDNQDLESIAL